jgi:DNA-binding PadR family transcriptional regulator
MNELAILGLLTEQPLHGYELKKRLTGVLGSRATLSFGSLYPALGRLERAGLVSALVAETPAAAVPMTGSLGGEVAAYRARVSLPTRARRNRKVYAITPLGEARLRELLQVPAPDDREFLLQVAFCRILEPPARLELFRARRAELESRLSARVETGRDPYLRSVRERDTETIAHDIAWLDRLISDELSTGADQRDPDTRPQTDDDHGRAVSSTTPDPALPGGAR